MRENVRHLFFWIWVTWLSMISSSPIHLPTGLMTTLFITACRTPQCIDTRRHSFVRWAHWERFHFLVTVSRTAMSTEASECLQNRVPRSFGKWQGVMDLFRSWFRLLPDCTDTNSEQGFPFPTPPSACIPNRFRGHSDWLESDEISKRFKLAFP